MIILGFVHKLLWVRPKPSYDKFLEVGVVEGIEFGWSKVWLLTGAARALKGWKLLYIP